jgi:hypothetical protein
VEPPYTISLSLPTLTAVPDRVMEPLGMVGARRSAGRAAGGRRHVHVRVDLRGPWVLLVRGVLVVLVDLALLAAAWALSHVIADGWMPRLPSPRRALRAWGG